MQDTENITPSNHGRYISVAILVILLAAIVLVCLCSLTPQGSFTIRVDTKAQTARDALASHIASESGGKLALADFTKADGQASQINGVEWYSLTFTGNVGISANGFWLTHNPMAGGGLTFTFSDTQGAFGGMNGAAQAHAGGRVKIAGRMDGQRTEKGWQFGLTECHLAQ